MTREDYIEDGVDEETAEVWAEMDRRGVDYGVCNPIKAKFAAEEEDEIRAKIRARRGR
jgi:hypothetical protein